MLVIITPATSNAPTVRSATPSGSDLQTPPELGQHLQHEQTNKEHARA